MQRSVGDRPSYLRLWHEFWTIQPTAKQLPRESFHKSSGIMNVSTVFPEGITETERPQQRHASASIKDDEEIQDRFNRWVRILIFLRVIYI
ncbi:unnamed protein product [Xylocopa violacea]|uniref:Uncharacterized protein n=1 Tax=Xylocopa violacea TaxID=135666 RepID=A0ABP1P4R7_XYLVO